MTTRTFYRAAVLGPFVGLVIAAAVANPSADLPERWGWVYPTSVTRGLMVYCLLAACLWIRIGREPASIDRLVWWVPLLYVALGWLLMLGLALVRGRVGELWPEQAGAILFRTGVHLAVGFGYVALATIALRLLRSDGRIEDETV